MLASLGQVALLALFWPVVLGLWALRTAEHIAALGLGVYFGVLQVRERWERH